MTTVGHSFYQPPSVAMKHLFAAAALFGLLVPLSLSACDGTDCGPFDSRFVTTDFASGAFAFAGSSDAGSNPDPPPELLPIGKDTLLYSDFAIQMRAQIETYALKRERGASFAFVSPAYACSPPLPSSEEVIQDIQVYSDADFNREYAAGDNLAALFDVVVPLQVDGAAYQQFDLRSFLATNPHPTGEVILLLKEAPQAASSFQFTVQYAQEGEGLGSYEFETEPVTLKAR
jgi:hypothetical protein